MHGHTASGCWHFCKLDVDNSLPDRGTSSNRSGTPVVDTDTPLMDLSPQCGTINLAWGNNNIVTLTTKLISIHSRSKARYK